MGRKAEQVLGLADGDGLEDGLSLRSLQKAISNLFIAKETSQIEVVFGFPFLGVGSEELIQCLAEFGRSFCCPDSLVAVEDLGMRKSPSCAFAPSAFKNLICSVFLPLSKYWPLPISDVYRVLILACPLMTGGCYTCSYDIAISKSGSHNRGGGGPRVGGGGKIRSSIRLSSIW